VTIPEREGWVDRNKLLDIQGRSRERQMALALARGIVDYPTSGGGCLLTDKVFSRRLRDLWEHEPEAGLAEIATLRYGRHLRLSPSSRLVVARNAAEAYELLRLRDRGLVLRPAVGGNRSLAVLFGEADPATLHAAARILVHYSPLRREGRGTVVCQAADGSESRLEVEPASADEVKRWRLE